MKHRPAGGGENWRDIEYVYAVGRVNNSQWPVIDVWKMDSIVKHLNKYNKVGPMHYALKDDGANMEMYARKVALLQVLKYMPKSVEVANAVTVAQAADAGRPFTIDGDMVVVRDNEGGADPVSDPVHQYDAPADDTPMPRSRSEAKRTAPQAPPAPPPADTQAGLLEDPDPSAPLSAQAIEFVRGKMEHDALGSADVIRKFGKGLTAFTVGEFPLLLAWLKNPSA